MSQWETLIIIIKTQQKCQRLMKEKTKRNKHHKKENENPPEILSAGLDKIKEEFISKCFKNWVGAWCISTYFFLLVN